jgi:DcaP outer membrane protein
MLPVRFFFGVMIVAALAGSAQAQAPAAPEQKPTMEELLQRIDALQRRAVDGDKVIDALKRRVEELETRDKYPKSHAQRREHVGAQKPAPVAAGYSQPVPTAAIVEPVPGTVVAPRAVQAMPALRPPERMGGQYDGEGQDALRSDLPGLSLRIPASQSEVRFYGFANVNGYRDLNARNQTDAPTVQTIPLAGSPAAIQGGDFGLSARFSRIGMDTRTATAWGTLETRIEGDFGGGAATSTNAVFRLRQAWGELGTEQYRVLVGWANSLWNEGVYETVNFATNLNQSFVRQPQIRAIATLAPGLTGQVSLEMPDTQYTSLAGVFTQNSTPAGFAGLSPAFTLVPDLLGRLDYRYDGLVLDMRGLLRDLTIRTEGTAAAPPALTRDAVGWGLAGTARFPMRWLSPLLGPDELIGMAYYGQGIGRYFGGNTFGQDALSNIGLPGTAFDFTLDALPTYGVSAAYRRFWMPELRSNFVYSYAWQQYPVYALFFVPGSVSATSLNSNMQQAIVNLIWSPFAELRGDTVGLGWLDVGFEYVYSHGNIFGGTAATVPAGFGYATANRVLGSVTMRF